MTLFEHPIFSHIVKYASLDEGRENLDFLQMPDQLRELAINVVSNCISCGAIIHPLRARKKSERSRIGGTETERRLFYAPTCPTEVNPGCSRTLTAKQHKTVVRAKLGGPREPLIVQVPTLLSRTESVETYDALCLKEPWLELILLGIKTLETRTKCMRHKSGDVVLASSTVDEDAWNDPLVGGLLTEAEALRVRAGLGKLRGLVTMGGFRPGVPGVDDAAACINIDYVLSSGRQGVRWVSPLTNALRVVERPTVRVRPTGEVVVGASQGFFKVPKNEVTLMHQEFQTLLSRNR